MLNLLLLKTIYLTNSDVMKKLSYNNDAFQKQNSTNKLKKYITVIFALQYGILQ